MPRSLVTLWESAPSVPQSRRATGAGPGSPARPGRRALAGPILAFALGLAAPAAAAPAAPATPGFDLHARMRALLRQAPDSALALARQRIAADPIDFLGHWLLAAPVSDSVQRADLLARARADSGDAGLQVEAGTVLLASGRTAAGRAALERARLAYAALGRPSDAARAALWKFAKRRDRRDRAEIASDLAQAERHARESGDPAAIAEILMARAGQEADASVERAVALNGDAVGLLEPLGSTLALAEALREQATALKSRGDFDAAEARYRRSIAIAVELRDTTLWQRTLSQLGDVHRGRGAYTDAQNAYLEALALARPAGDPGTLADRWGALGGLALERGRWREARRCFEESLRQFDALERASDDKVHTLAGLGSVDALTGDYEAARARFDQALAFCRARGLERQSASVLNRLAGVHLDLGHPDEAARWSDQALAAARGTGNRRMELLVLSTRADIEGGLGHGARALDWVRRAKALAAEVEPRRLGGVRRGEAAVLLDLGRSAQAAAVLDTALAEAEAARDTSEQGRDLQLLGVAAHLGGDAPRAVALLERSLALADALGSPERAANVRLALGAAQLDAGRPWDAIASLESGLGWFERVRSSVRASEDRSGWQASYQDAFVSLVTAYVRTGQVHAAFATLERSRAREMRRLAGARTPGLARGPALRPTRELERAEADLAGVQATLRREYDRPARERSRDTQALESEADSLRRRWTVLARRLEREAPDYARASGVTPLLAAREVSRRLGAGERVLAFATGPHGTLRFDLGPGGITAREIAWNEAALEGRVGALVEALGDAARGRWPALASACAETLLAGIELGGRGPARLFIVPDGALHGLPFEVLPLGGEPTRRPLIELAEIAYAPSVSLLLRAPPRRPAAPGGTVALAAFGDPAPRAGDGAREARGGVQGEIELGPLPHARREVEALERLYPGGRVYVGAEATEERFFAEAPRAAILHLAAHAVLDDARPAFSGIALAPATGGRGAHADGWLQAFEVLETPLAADLATLSACESGRGTLRRGEGLLGLARAFQLAGARRLLVSLWKVDDALTADFMSDFYRRLRRGGTAAAALRATKLAMLGSGAPAGRPAEAVGAARGVGVSSRAASLAAPSAWAAFVLVGARER
jgi:CHAT domain-containing protein/tetratricopeptide (TPR) repeat protein